MTWVPTTGLYAGRLGDGHTALRGRFGRHGRLPPMIEPQLSAEQRARLQIDRQLSDAGWHVQGRAALNLFAGQGVAVREVIMRPGHGRADYLLYVDQRAVGVI